MFGEEVEAAGTGGNTGNQLAARVWQLLSGLDERLAGIEERLDHGQQRLDLNVRAPKRAGTVGADGRKVASRSKDLRTKSGCR